MAGAPADSYISEVFVPTACRILGSRNYTVESIRSKLREPRSAFIYFLSNYGVLTKRARTHIASVRLAEAVSRTIADSSFEDFLGSRDSEALWESYIEVCSEDTKKVNATLDMPSIIDLTNLAFDIYEELGHGNIVAWIRDEIAESRRCDTAFSRLVGIRTFGPKAASAALRDVAFLYELEKQIEYSDWLYLQPINKVVRQIAKIILPEEGVLPDWILAGKVSKAVRLSQASGVRFSMGCSYFGYRLAPRTGGIEQALQLLNRPDFTST
ncbi:MAG: hypothetical protein KIT74_10235 [Fimbriimonadales bacterium]|nr:hypothetical protein [Fimbriimonadales bacterium]